MNQSPQNTQKHRHQRTGRPQKAGNFQQNHESHHQKVEKKKNLSQFFVHLQKYHQKSQLCPPRSPVGSFQHSALIWFPLMTVQQKLCLHLCGNVLLEN
eukprot:TRINITY_DN129_c0_g1_i11.p2 TRINITY_DN129_c0_g1~~TRINITY_DN129_c0_g1_i11.p2  ORF type:complete len:98 (+),score=16.39 TRINITY_DN129_c0_g1_i11:238-531(+)